MDYFSDESVQSATDTAAASDDAAIADGTATNDAFAVGTASGTDSITANATTTTTTIWVPSAAATPVLFTRSCTANLHAPTIWPQQQHDGFPTAMVTNLSRKCTRYDSSKNIS
jgi:hypothetical protein